MFEMRAKRYGHTSVRLVGASCVRDVYTFSRRVPSNLSSSLKISACKDFIVDV